MTGPTGIDREATTDTGEREPAWLAAPASPFPSAETLRLLETTAPGTVDRVLRVIETQQTSLADARTAWAQARLQDAKTRAATAPITAHLHGATTRRTQWLVFMVLAGLTSCIGYAIHRDNPLAATTLAVLVAIPFGLLLLGAALPEPRSGRLQDQCRCRRASTRCSVSVQ